MDQTTVSGRVLRGAGLIATAAGLLGGLADLLLLYTPGFGQDVLTMTLPGRVDALATVASIPPGRSVAGLLLGVFVIPALGLGYWMLYERFRPLGHGKALPLLFVGLFGPALGNAIHESVALVARVLIETQPAPAAALDTALPYAPYVIPLYVVFYAGLLAVSGYVAYLVYQPGSPLPRWLIWLTPISPNIIVNLLAVVSPLIADVGIPSIANLSHALFFGVVTLACWGMDGATGNTPVGGGNPG